MNLGFTWQDAAFFWPETKDDPSIDFNVPEVFTPDRKAEIRAVDPSVLKELRDAGVPIDIYFDWYSSWRHAAADGVLADAAAHAIRTRKPGLLAIHILITDQAQHNYGPHHYLASAALTQADESVGILRQAVKDAGIDQENVMFNADGLVLEGLDLSGSRDQGAFEALNAAPLDLKGPWGQALRNADLGRYHLERLDHRLLCDHPPDPPV